MKQKTLFLAVMFACAYIGALSQRQRLKDWMMAGDEPGVRFAQLGRWRESVGEAMGRDDASCNPA